MRAGLSNTFGSSENSAPGPTLDDPSEIGDSRWRGSLQPPDAAPGGAVTEAPLAGSPARAPAVKFGSQTSTAPAWTSFHAPSNDGSARKQGSSVRPDHRVGHTTHPFRPVLRRTSIPACGSCGCVRRARRDCPPKAGPTGWDSRTTCRPALRLRDVAACTAARERHTH